jgi:hypothetical protein
MEQREADFISALAEYRWLLEWAIGQLKGSHLEASDNYYFAEKLFSTVSSHHPERVSVWKQIYDARREENFQASVEEEEKVSQ